MFCSSKVTENLLSSPGGRGLAEEIICCRREVGNFVLLLKGGA